MVYKFATIVLAAALAITGGVHLYQKNAWGKEKNKLNNALAETLQMQKETKTAYSRLAIELEDLKTTSNELQEIIEERNESILALTEANVRLKDKLIKFKNASQSAQDSQGNPVVIPEVCQDENLRFMVAFDEVKDPYRVKGYTLTNPAYAEVSIEWVRGILLQIILTKDESNTFRVYLDSDSEDIIPAELRLKVDPSVFDRNWYEKISIGGNTALGVGGFLISLDGMYDLSPSFSLGPSVNIVYDGDRPEVFYGLAADWYPWRR